MPLPLLWLAAAPPPAPIAARFAVVAPPADPHWWTLASEADLLALAEPGRTWAAAGIGMGGQAAVRLGLRHPDRVAVAAAIDAAFDFHDLYGRGTALDALFPSRERARQDTAVLHLNPARWPHLWFAADPAGPWHRGADRLHEKLTAYGVPHACDLDTTGPDHTAKKLPEMVAFVAAALQQEARRLM